jgi:hypothetical protein
MGSNVYVMELNGYVMGLNLYVRGVNLMEGSDVQWVSICIYRG